MTWYESRTANSHQVLVVDQSDGRNVAVTYDRKDARLIAKAPELLELARELVAGDETAHEFNFEEWLSLLAVPARALIAEIEGGEAND